MEGKRENKGVRGMWNGERERKGSKRAERGSRKKMLTLKRSVVIALSAS